MPSSNPTRKLNVPGGTLAYDDVGQGPPIVFLHEGIADRRMWDRDAARLSARHRVIRYDQRGYGESPPASGPYSSVEDLKELVGQLKLGRPVIVGPSMGGRTAVDFAVQNPDLVSGLFLVAPAPPTGTKMDMVPMPPEAIAEDERLSKIMVESWTKGDVDRAVEATRELWGAALKGPGLEKFREMVRHNAAEAFGERSGQHDRGAGAPTLPDIGKLSIPVEIVVGAVDAPMQLPFARFVEQKIPGAHLEILPGADHLPNVSTPEAFDRLFDSFLDRVHATSSRAQRSG